MSATQRIAIAPHDDTLDVSRRNAQRIELTFTAELQSLFARAVHAQELCRRVKDCNCTACPVAKTYVSRIHGLMRAAGLPLPNAAKPVLIAASIKREQTNG